VAERTGASPTIEELRGSTISMISYAFDLGGDMLVVIRPSAGGARLALEVHITGDKGSESYRGESNLEAATCTKLLEELAQACRRKRADDRAALPNKVFIDCPGGHRLGLSGRELFPGT
jgi:hypothetical protein